MLVYNIVPVSFEEYPDKFAIQGTEKKKIKNTILNLIFVCTKINKKKIFFFTIEK